jgi:hypothetical protein
MQKKGFEIEDVGGRGIGTGVRLRARKGLIRREIAVRTSDDRKVGLTRTPDGKWRTVSDVDEVLVAAISKNDPTTVEIFSFLAPDLVEAFDRLLKNYDGFKRGRGGKLPPVFMSLDILKRDPAGIRSNLKCRAKPPERFPLRLAAVSKIPATETMEEFIDRIVNEYAARVGADADNVTVEFHHKGKANPIR